MITQTKKPDLLKRPTRSSQEEAYGANPKEHAKRVQQVLRSKETQPDPTETRIAEMRTRAQANRTIQTAVSTVTGVGGLPSTECYDDFPLPPPRRASQSGIEFTGERVRLDHLSGKFIIVRTDEIWADGMELVITHVDRAWVHFVDNVPVNTIVFQPGVPYPVRDELLPPTPQGKQSPWRDTYYLHCVDPVTGESYTFYHSAITGLLSLEALITRIHRQRTAPDHQPLVRFSATHAPAKGGYPAYWYPAPKLVGWVLPDGTQITV